MEKEIFELKKIIDTSKRIVLFTGAGISCGSGIPDFRSADGIYNKKLNSIFSPEEIISHSFFMAHPDIFFDFYKSKMVYPDAVPNKAHLYFAGLKNIESVVTQNIDDLHNMAGSKNVYELHGSVKRNYCMECGSFYKDTDLYKSLVPRCTCGGIIKPDVVLYEELLDEEVIENAVNSIMHADTMIIVGTSLAVYPAASFIRYFRGNKLVIINKTPTDKDYLADLVIYDDIINVVKNLEVLNDEG